VTRTLHRFHGGIHLPDQKALSLGRPLRQAALPSELVLPLQQHIGAAAQPLVAVGERVLEGQMVARPEGFVSAPVHAPTSGTVIAIEARPVPHPSGLSALAIVLQPDGEGRTVEYQPHSDWSALDPSTLRNLIRDAGIVGLGGAGFPTAVKLNPGPHTAVETLILNGAECEPYITCDQWLMQERPEEIISGALIMRHALQAQECLIGIEDNKPAAIAALRSEVARRGLTEAIEVVEVPTRYPMGGEKQLIKVLTGKEVPTQGLPIAVGVVCHNVATAASVHRAVELGEPLIRRIVTVTGHGAAQPGNFEVPLGIPMGELLAQAGGTTAGFSRLIMGGPMMGITVEQPQAPVIKTANCLLAVTDDELERRAPVRPCIRCGSCAEACPVSLLPQQLYWYAKSKEFDRAQDYNLFDCIECGCCAFVCPSNLPLVQYYRYAKTEIWAQEREKRASDQARRRHEYRVAREERERLEKEARAKKKAAALAEGESDDKKAAIQAAIERAKAKKAQANATPPATDPPAEQPAGEGAAPAEEKH